MSATEAMDVPPVASSLQPARTGALLSYLISLWMFLQPRAAGRAALRIPLISAIVVALINLALLVPVIQRVAANAALRGVVLYPWVFFSLLAGGYFIVLFFVVLPFVPRPGSNGLCLRHVTRSVLLGTSLIWPFALGYAVLYTFQYLGYLTYLFDALPVYVGITGLVMAYTTWAIARAAGVDYRRPEDMPPPPEPHCDNCGYDLRASTGSEYCPECGRLVADSLSPAARPGTPWEKTPQPWRLRLVLGQIGHIFIRPQELFALMPARTGHTAARRWLAVSAVLVAALAGLMIPAMRLTGVTFLDAVSWDNWPIYLLCTGVGIIWAFLGLMMVGVETLGLTVVSWYHGRSLMLSTACKVTSYASTLLLPWVIISLLFFAAAGIAYDTNYLRAGPLAPWRDNLFVGALAISQIIGLLWFEFTVYRGLRRVQYANH